MTNITYRLEEIVENCDLCNVVNKPYIQCKVYTYWLPSITEKLVITESPPPGIKENFFYNLNRNDRLRSILKKLLRLEEMSDLKFLQFLKDNRIFLTNSVKCRPYSKRDLEDMRRRCIYVLTREIKLMKPQIIIAMGKSAIKSLNQILNMKFRLENNEYFRVYNINDYKIVITLHPLYIWRFLHNRIDKISNNLITILMR